MTEAYKVGITIALTNKISQGLMLIQGDLVKTDQKAKDLHKTLGQIKKLGLYGAVLGGAGYMGLRALDKGYEAAKKYEQALNQFKALNLGDSVNRDADKFARGSQLMGVSATDLIGTVKELHTVLNNYGESKSFAPIIAQMQYANKAVGGEKGAAAFNEGQRQMMGKVLEYRGGTSQAEQFVQADYMQHVMSGTGFMVMPRDYRNMLSTGKIAAQQMSNDAFYYKTEPIVQFMGGNGVGTGLMTAYNRMILGMGAGSPGGKAYLVLLDKLHLVKKGHFEHNALTGKITKVLPDFLKDSELYKSDPFAFLEEKLVPSLRAAGYNEQGIQTAIQQIYGRTGGPVFNQYHTQYMKGKAQGKFATDAKAMGLQALLDLAKGTPQGANMAVGAAWENLKIAAGESLIPIIIPWLLKFAETLRDVGDWINHHPVKFDYAVKGFAILAATLTAAGSLLLGVAAMKAFGLVIPLILSPLRALAVFFVLNPIALIITAAVVGIYEIYKHWGVIKPKLLQVWSGIKSWISNIVDYLAGIWSNLTSHTVPAGQSTLVDNGSWKPSSNAKTGFVTPPPSGNNRNVTMHGNVNLDGKKVGDFFGKAFADSMGRASTSSSSFFDTRAFPTLAGSN